MAHASGSSVILGQDELRSFSWFEIKEDIANLHEFSLVCPRSALAAISSGNNQQGWNVSEKIGSPVTFNITGIETRRGRPKDFRYKGIITSISAYRNPVNSTQEDVLIEGFSSDILLNDYPNCRSFDDKSISDIVDQILMAYPQDLISKTGTIQDSTRYPYIVQYKETNLEFLRRLLRNFGVLFYYDGQNLVCGRPDQRTEETGIFGINIPNVKIRSSVSALNFRTKYHDFVHDTISTGEASNVSLDSFVGRAGTNALNKSLSLYPQSREGFMNYFNAFNTQPDPVNDKVSIQKKVLATNLVLVTGSTFTPLHVGNLLFVFPRHQSNNDPTTIDMGGYLITKVVHHLDNTIRNYTSTFEGIPSEMDLISGDGGIRAPYCPVQNAVVTDNNDPDKMGRVKVRFDWQADGQNTPWIRMVNPHSGDSRGFYFVPEIGDEVVVGFEHNHPQKPYVMGTMFGGNHSPEENWVTNSNDIKKIRTKSGHTLEFNDTSGSETLVIYNGSGSSADSNSNKITLALSPNKITIESQGDIELKATNIKLDAQGNLDIHGTGVSLKADGEFKAEGATAEIDGTGQVKIQGGIVQIN